MIHFRRSRSVLFTVLILFCCGVPSLTAGQAAGRYTLADCLDHALRNDEALLIQNERRAQAGERVRQADAGRLPVIDFRFSRLFRDTSGTSAAGDGTDSRLALFQPLYEGSRRANVSRLARSAFDREEYQLSVVTRLLKADVAQAFFNVARVESDIKNITDTLALLRERRNELATRVRLGKSRDSELLMVESQIAGLQAQQEKLKGDHTGAWISLSRLTGMDPAASTVVFDTDSVPILSGDGKMTEAAGRRSDVRTAEQDLAAQNIRIALARGAYLPTLGLDGSWYLSRSGSLSGSDWELLFALNFPLYNGGGTKALVEEQRAAEREYRLRLARVRRDAETELDRISADLAASIAQIAPYRNAWEQADKSAGLQRRDYRLGLMTNLDVLQSMTAVLEAKKALDRAILQSQLNKTLWDIAIEIE